MQTPGQLWRINSGLTDYFLTDNSLYIYKEGTVTTSILLIAVGLLIGFLYTGLLIGIVLGLLLYWVYTYLARRKGIRIKTINDVETLYQGLKVRKYNWNELSVERVDKFFQFTVTDADGRTRRYSFRITEYEKTYISQKVPQLINNQNNTA
ncbi:MAG: hypothetical protein JRN19_00580 [Nitrososphaerota archaeon]|nr:hypothetical protein [Nitrososphaerota archaeon]MDG7049108.1 hypothetical protein [Nitrososphaerota archaeon]MDG7050945.1 hypothetical protein [Nitrososphaerota archaeon]